MNLLSVRAIDPPKYALALMDILFTDEQMRQSVYKTSRHSPKPGLDCEKISLLEGI